MAETLVGGSLVPGRSTFHPPGTARRWRGTVGQTESLGTGQGRGAGTPAATRRAGWSWLRLRVLWRGRSDIECDTARDHLQHGMETGATTGLFPSDEQTHEWLAIQQRETEWQPLAVAIKVHQVPRSRYWRGGVYSGRLTRAEQEANLVATAGRARKNGRVLVGTHQGIFCRLPQASREDQGGL